MVPKPNNWWRLILDLSSLNKIQNGDTRNNKDLPPDRGVGYIHRFQGRLLSYTHTKPIKKIPAISCPGSNIPVQGTTIWSVHSAHGVYCSGQISQTDGDTKGCKDPPVPRLVNMERSELDPKEVFDFVGYQFDLKEGKVRPNLERRQTLTAKIRDLLAGPTCLVRQLISLIGLLTATESPSGSVTHETRTVTLEKQLEGTRITRKGDPHTQITAPPLKVAAGGHYTPRSTITPTKTCSAYLYRCIKRRVGPHLNTLQGEPGPFQKARCT